MAINLNEWIDDVDAAKAASAEQVSDAVSSLRTQFRGDEKRHGQRIIAAAYTTRAALVAETHTKADLSRVWGKNASMITLYNRLGIVAFDLGILPKVTGNGGKHFSDDVSVWTLLAGQGGGTISAVGQYIEKGAVTEYKPNDKGEVKPVYDGNPTASGLVALLADYFKPNGEKKDPKERKANEARREANLKGEEYVEETDSDDETPETVEGTRTIEARFRNAVKDITTLAPELDSEKWESFQDMLGAMSKALKEKATFEKKAATAKAS